MQVVIVGHVDKFLPHYGVAWADSGKPETVFVSEVTDTRCSSFLKEWVQAVLVPSRDPIKVFLVTQSASLKDDVFLLLNEILGEGDHIDIVRKSPVEVQPLEDDSILTSTSQAYRLLPELAMQARGFLRAFFPELAKTGQLKWMGRLSSKVTTLTRYNAFMLGVIDCQFSQASQARPVPGKVSLTSFLSKCSSPMGKRRVESTLIHPFLDVSVLKYKLALVRQLMEDRIVRNKLQNVCLSKCLDLDKFTYQLHTVTKQDDSMKRRLVVNTFAALSHTLSSVNILITLLNTHCPESQVPGINEYFLTPITKNANGLKKLYDLINHVFVVEKLEAATVDPSAIILNPSLVDVAAQSKRQIEEINDAMERIRVKAEEDLCGLNSGKIKLTTTQGGKVLRAPKSVDVTSKYKLVRVNKSETQFTTSKLEELNDRLGSSTDMVEGCERAFIAKALDVTRTYMEPLKHLADLLGALDILCCTAAAVSLINRDNSWCIPEFIEGQAGGSQIVVEAGRHPLLEIQESLRGRTSSIVPNNTVLGSSRKSLLITGPNMGGKSTYARQVALHSVLAQTGIPCPSKATRLTPMELVWTRVGAHDSPAGGASTFMTEASETAAMLSAVAVVEGPSCVVLDELGRGTSACDGLAFAAAVLKKLLSFDHCLSVFATHFHELALMPLQGVHALCMASPSSSIATGLPAFTYKLEDGVESDSDGILLAKAFGFPSSVIHQALLLVKE